MAGLGVQTRDRRDVRAIVYRVVASLVGLFLLAISAPWLLWPFGPMPLVDVTDPDAFRWWAGEWGTFMGFFFAIPLLATVRRPKETAGLVQYWVIGWMAVIILASGILLGEWPVDNLVIGALVVASYPEPRALLRFERSSDKRMLAITAVALLALVPFVQENVRLQGSDVGSETHDIGIYLHGLYIVGLTVLAGVLAAFRRPGTRTLVMIVGAAFVYLGAASIVVPDHAGSWGYVWGGVSLLAGAGTIAFARRQLEHPEGSRAAHPV